MPTAALPTLTRARARTTHAQTHTRRRRPTATPPSCSSVSACSISTAERNGRHAQSPLRSAHTQRTYPAPRHLLSPRLPPHKKSLGGPAPGPVGMGGQSAPHPLPLRLWMLWIQRTRAHCARTHTHTRARTRTHAHAHARPQEMAHARGLRGEAAPQVLPPPCPQRTANSPARIVEPTSRPTTATATATAHTHTHTTAARRGSPAARQRPLPGAQARDRVSPCAL